MKFFPSFLFFVFVYVLFSLLFEEAQREKENRKQALCPAQSPIGGADLRTLTLRPELKSRLRHSTDGTTKASSCPQFTFWYGFVEMLFFLQIFDVFSLKDYKNSYYSVQRSLRIRNT